MAMAPAEGLFLAEVLFTNYTQRCDFKSNMPISLEGVADEVEEFVQARIRPAIAAGAPAAMEKWLEKDVLYERVPTSLALRLEQQSLKSGDAEEFDE
jgi:hypothetical protein